MITGKRIEADGTEIWYKEGRMHKLDGPAYTHSNGMREWLRDGERHRLDGPALIFCEGYQSWTIDSHDWPDQHREWWER